MGLNVDIGQVGPGWGDPDAGAAFLRPPALLEDEGDRSGVRGLPFEGLGDGRFQSFGAIVVEEAEQQPVLALKGVAPLEGRLEPVFGFRDGDGQTAGGGPLPGQQGLVMGGIHDELMANRRTGGGRPLRERRRAGGLGFVAQFGSTYKGISLGHSSCPPTQWDLPSSLLECE